MALRAAKAGTSPGPWGARLATHTRLFFSPLESLVSFLVIVGLALDGPPLPAPLGVAANGPLGVWPIHAVHWRAGFNAVQ